MTSFRRILCPVDFSEPSRTALEHAETLARVLEAELLVAHVVTPTVYPVDFGAVPVGPGPALVEQDISNAAAEGLQRLVSGLTGRGLRASSLVDVGTPSRRIVDWVREHGIDLVVLGTHGLTGLGHVLLGSTAERVVRHCPCPVLTVKAGQLDS